LKKNIKVFKDIDQLASEHIKNFLNSYGLELNYVEDT
jgi:hypothetical protein